MSGLCRSSVTSSVPRSSPAAVPTLTPTPCHQNSLLRQRWRCGHPQIGHAMRILCLRLVQTAVVRQFGYRSRCRRVESVLTWADWMRPASPLLISFEGMLTDALVPASSVDSFTASSPVYSLGLERLCCWELQRRTDIGRTCCFRVVSARLIPAAVCLCV